MKGLTATMTAAAREARNHGLAEWPIPLHKLEEIAEHLQRLDRVVLAAEVFYGWNIGVKPGEPWDTESVERLQVLRAALDEVRS